MSVSLLRRLILTTIREQKKKGICAVTLENLDSIHARSVSEAGDFQIM